MPHKTVTSADQSIREKFVSNVDNSPPSPKNAIRRFFEGMPHMLSHRPYPKPLPESVAPWHCYILDSGHSILCLMAEMKPSSQRRGNALEIPEVKSLLQSYNLEDVLSGSSSDIEGWLVPVSVKGVLRNYRIERGYVVANVDFDEILGVVEDKEDYEY